MRNLIILTLSIFIFIAPSSSYASHIQLKPCIEVSHCAAEQLDVKNIDKPLEKIRTIVENTPRTEIVDFDEDYLHAEVTSRLMKYVDDLEISYSPETSIIDIRSESRVGEGDFGVNKKRVLLISNQFFNN